MEGREGGGGGGALQRGELISFLPLKRWGAGYLTGGGVIEDLR